MVNVVASFTYLFLYLDSGFSESILSRFEELVEYSHNHDTDAIMTMILPDSKVLMDGLPPVAGVEGTYAAWCLFDTNSQCI